MPVNLELHPSGHYIIYRIAEPWTIAELNEAYVREKQLRDDTPHTLHSITDFSGVVRIPNNWLQSRTGPGFSHPRSGYIVLVGQRPLVKAIVDVILKIVRYQRVKQFDTFEEAEAFLQGVLADENNGTAV